MKIIKLSLLALKKITLKTGEEAKLVRISNPWGTGGEYGHSKYRKKL